MSDSRETQRYKHDLPPEDAPLKSNAGLVPTLGKGIQEIERINAYLPASKRVTMAALNKAYMKYGNRLNEFHTYRNKVALGPKQTREMWLLTNTLDKHERLIESAQRTIRIAEQDIADLRIKIAEQTAREAAEPNPEEPRLNLLDQALKYASEEIANVLDDAIQLETDHYLATKHGMIKGE